MLKRFYRKLPGKLFLAGICLLMNHQGIGQPAISGPVCILPGTRYQYLISGNWDSTSTMRICVTGGVLDSGDSCSVEGPVQYSVFVTWSNEAGKKIEVVSSAGNNSLSVQGTTELSGGQIDDSDRVQVFKKEQADYTFHCSAATGGSCNPYYLYQWQKSENGLEWKDVEGAVNRDLQFSEMVLVNTYFRRVTTEAHSNTEAYSDSALLSVVFK